MSGDYRSDYNSLITRFSVGEAFDGAEHIKKDHSDARPQGRAAFSSDWLELQLRLEAQEREKEILESIKNTLRCEPTKASGEPLGGLHRMKEQHENFSTSEETSCS